MTKLSFRVALLWPLLLVILWGPFAMAASGNDSPPPDDRHLLLSRSLEYVRDPDHQLTIEQVIEQQNSLPWEHSEASVPNLGMSDDTLWYRVTIANPQPVSQEKYLELSYAKLDDVTLYFVRDGQVVQRQNFGDLLPFSARPIAHRNFVTPIVLPPRSNTLLLVKLHSSGALQMPLELWDKEAFIEGDQGPLSLQMMFAGLMVALGAYNLLLFFAIRDISYLWYVLNVFSIALAQLSMSGITSQYLWPDWPILNNVTLIAFFALNLTFGALFTYHFLQLPRHSPRLARLVQVMVAWGAVLFLASFVADYTLVIQTLSVSATVITPLILAIGIYLWVRGVVLARIYTVAWFFLLIGHTLQALGKIGAIPHSLMTEYGPEIGTSIESLLLSFALAFRFNQERRQRIEAQQAALQVKEEANRELEARVRERTQELENANKRLQAISSRDGLTEVHNRRYFDNTLSLEWRRSLREKSQLGLLLIDVDHFKITNDTYGHLCGDACLKHLARLFEETVNRAGDTVARYGGEEFVILMSHTSPEGARLVAERIRRAVCEANMQWEGETIPLTVSIGVACMIPTMNLRPEDLVAHADIALYQAKTAGRNRVMGAEEPAPQAR
ncbi:diguanylate cyclase [Marinobacteraceae bacterium S3BR75-40.1]